MQTVPISAVVRCCLCDNHPKVLCIFSIYQPCFLFAHTRFLSPTFGIIFQAFAFLELKTIELATAVLQLDGIVYKDTQLKMRRPSDYNPSMVPAK